MLRDFVSLCKGRYLNIIAEAITAKSGLLKHAKKPLFNLSFITSYLCLCRCVSSVPGHLDVLPRGSVVCSLLGTRTYHGSTRQDGKGVPRVNNLCDHSKLNFICPRFNQSGSL